LPVVRYRRENETAALCSPTRRSDDCAPLYDAIASARFSTLGRLTVPVSLFAVFTARFPSPELVLLSLPRYRRCD
jgi:hypothetical protein